jgi:uncharacterized protein YciI
MVEPTPAKLFISICKINQEHAEKFAKFFKEGVPLPPDLHAVRLKHVQYYDDLTKRGILWLSGSWTDHSGGMQVYAADSLEKAKEIQNNDPLVINGSMYDLIYHEWEVHTIIEKLYQRLENKLPKI